MAGWLTGDMQPGASIAPPQPLALGLSPDTQAKPVPSPLAAREEVASLAQREPQSPNAPSGGRGRVVSFWEAQGVPRHVAEGIADRVNVESGFNPSIMGDGDTSGGMYQHHAERLARLKEFANKSGRLWSDPSVQNEFSLTEVLGGDTIATQHWAEIRNAPDRETANKLWTKYFERPAATMRDAWTTPIDEKTLAGLPPELQEIYKKRSSASEQLQSTLAGKAAEYHRVASSAPAGSKELDAAIADVRKAAAEDRSAYRQMIQHPPIQKPVDAWQNFGSAATLVGLFGGLFARQHATAALGAAGAVMQAINTNNSEEYQRSFKQWQTQAEMAHTLMSMENEDIRSLLQDKRMAVDEKVTRLQNLVAEAGMIKTIGGMPLDNLDRIADFYEKRLTTTTAFKAQAESVKAAYAQTEYSRVMAETGDQAKAYEAYTTAYNKGSKTETLGAGREDEIKKAVEAKDTVWGREHPGATKEEKSAAHFKHRTEAEQALSQATHAPRSAPAMFMQKFMQEHPEADADAMAMAAARYRQLGALEQAFGSGTQGNTIRSLNVAIDHTDVLKQLGEALQNNDVQKLNALKNRVLVEFGYEGPVNFDVAKKIVADEVVKSVLGNNVGTGAERLEMQADFDRANSPEQLNGVIETARRLMLGQMRGLEFQYAGQDERRREAFREKLFDHTKAALETTDKTRGSGQAKYSVGQIIPGKDGKKYRITRGDLNGDPDVELVK